MSLSPVLSLATEHTNANGDVSLPTDALDRALQAAETKQRKPRKTKKIKDPNAPTRPCNAYVRWLNENRAAIRDELTSTNPHAKITDVSKKAGEVWASLTDEEKAPFNDAAKAEYAAYHEAMKNYKPNYTIPGTKKTKIAYDLDETPDAPSGWTGPHDMKFIKGTVKGADGKSIRPIKNWDQAVQAVIEVNQAWSNAKTDGSLPSHWNDTTRPCAGITKTSTGYHPRAGAIQALIDTPETKRNGGIASWLFTPAEPTPVVETETEPTPVVETETEPAVEPETEPAPMIEPETEPAPMIEPETEPAVEPETEPETEPANEVDAPKKKIVKSKTKKAKPVSVNLDECDEIETERDGAEFSCYRHTLTNKLYSADDLCRPIGAIIDVIDDETGKQALDEDGDPEQDIEWF